MTAMCSNTHITCLFGYGYIAISQSLILRINVTGSADLLMRRPVSIDRSVIGVADTRVDAHVWRDQVATVTTAPLRANGEWGE